MQIAGVELEDLEYDNMGSWPWKLKSAVLVLTTLLTLYLGYMFFLSDVIDEYTRKKK